MDKQKRVINPFDAAMTDEPSRFSGKVEAQAYTCVLVKGQGKVAYDAAVHGGERTSTAITIIIEPLDVTRQFITREMLNWTQDFKGIVRPSLEILAPKVALIRKAQLGQFNVLEEISGLYVIGTFVERPDNKPGETWTTFRFDDVFATEAECREAAGVDDDPFAPQPGDPGFEPEAAATVKNAAMADFLPGLWGQAGHDVTKMAEILASNPMMVGYSIDDPEVQNVVNS